MKAQPPSPSPPQEENGDGRTRAVRTLIERAATAGFSQLKLRPQADAMVAILDAGCPSDEDIGLVLPLIANIVRRYRLPGYFLAFWLQLLTHRRQSPYHVLSCRLFSDAQTHLAESLAVNSLENAYTALVNWHQVKGDESLTPVAVALVTTQMPERTPVLSLEGMVAASERLKRAGSQPFEYLLEDLIVRLSAYHEFYARWATPFNYMDNNPISENLYWHRTLGELSLAHPIETMHESQPGGLLFLIEQLTAAEHAPTRLVARRMLATVSQAGGDLETAIKQYRLGVKEAEDEDVEAELGHMRRGLGFALYATQQFKEAARQFELAFQFESSMPTFSYWAALSASELGNARLAAMSGKEIKTKAEAAALLSAREAYSAGRNLWERDLAAEAIPVDRAVKQQLFRSYRSNAVQVALMTQDLRELLIEIESTAPREAGELIAEIRASRSLPAGEMDFRAAAATFQQHLTSVPDDFTAYLSSLIANRQARNTYLQARAGDKLTVAAFESQSSEHLLDQLLDADLPGVVILALDVALVRSTFAYVVPDRKAVIIAGSGDFGERDLHGVRSAFVAALSAAEQLVDPARSSRVCGAIDDLVVACERQFGGVLEAGLNLYRGRRLVILPRLAMTSFPIHAMRVGGARLVEQCEVSYAPSLSALLAAHDRPGSIKSSTLLMVHDDMTAPLFAGTVDAISAVYGERATVLRRPTWKAFLDAAKGADGELFFACHGSHDPLAPAASCLWFDRRSAPPVTFADLLSDFDASRFESVVLGACESGLVRAEVAAEYAGLPVVFLASGVRHVVSSLWRAHQVATAILLDHYFAQRVNGAAVATALCAAQRAVMSITRDEVVSWLEKGTPEQAKMLVRPLGRMGAVPFAHPYYWGAFQASGDV
jgi:tetratricopeptide (TPR) repeat protein